jgi:hypothetical protein
MSDISDLSLSSSDEDEERMPRRRRDVVPYKAE